MRVFLAHWHMRGREDHAGEQLVTDERDELDPVVVERIARRCVAAATMTMYDDIEIDKVERVQ